MPSRWHTVFSEHVQLEERMRSCYEGGAPSAMVCSQAAAAGWRPQLQKTQAAWNSFAPLLWRQALPWDSRPFPLHVHACQTCILCKSTASSSMHGHHIQGHGKHERHFWRGVIMVLSVAKQATVSRAVQSRHFCKIVCH